MTGGENKKGGRQAGGQTKREDRMGESCKSRRWDAKGGWGRRPEVRTPLLLRRERGRGESLAPAPCVRKGRDCRPIPMQGPAEEPNQEKLVFVSGGGEWAAGEGEGGTHDTKFVS